jgi:hypothetical protein
MKAEFVPLSREDLRQRYGDFYNNHTGTIDPMQVPIELRDLIPYAELWGIGDDFERDRLVEASGHEAREDLQSIFATRSKMFDDWLAGPEADGPDYSEAYIAFSNMRIAYDYLSAL